jgi:hypothetical protein
MTLASPNHRFMMSSPVCRSVILAFSLFALSACLQTNPDETGSVVDLEKTPEDDGRRAGASSSTNWPNEFVHNQNKAVWSFDSVLRIEFFEIPRVAPAWDSSVRRSGTIYLYPGKAIPALDSIKPIFWNIDESSSFEIPIQKIRETAASPSDTIWFNVRLDLDSLHGWFQGFQLERRTGKLVETPFSPFPEKTVFLKFAWFYFKGSVSQVTSLLPPPPGSNPEISFYIPGTPKFCKAVTDSFQVGPLPKGEYPLRIIRTTSLAGSVAGTLVEVWELNIKGQDLTATFTLGEQVLAFQSTGKITLRLEE